jgi:DNA repair protein RecN (Recombination protein N)
MLTELRIKNFTIIDDLSIGFGPGLNILTGETGAGKSIIVDALGIILGEKASQDLIKSGKKEASIEACFDTITHPQLEELSIESNEGIIIRRTIAAQGKGRAYINDTPVSLQTLATVAGGLVDIHGQHEQQGLLRKESHLSFVDAYGGFQDLLLSVQERYREALETRNNVSAIKEKARERGQRIEFLSFQVNEIDTARLKQGEKEALEEERRILLNLSRLKESSETAYMLLYEAEGSSLEKLAAAAAKVREMAQIDHSAGELLNALESAIPLLEDAAIVLRSFKDRYDIDPRKLEDMEDRLELIKKLQKKYGDSVEEILHYRDTALEELNTLENIEERTGALEAELAVIEKELLAAAEDLSDKRKAAALIMESLVVSELRELGFQKALFKVDSRNRDKVTATGLDDLEFLFSANPGEPVRSLIKVASGGELSRIMLALKCIEIAAGHRLTGKIKSGGPSSGMRTLIFDEVDAGIGGVTAQHVGDRLKAIAGSYQVLCITHLPQIAALADRHLMVQKAMAADHTDVAVIPLTNGKRQEELARMLSGRVTEVSLKHAKELLGSGQKQADKT